ncbi:porin family protein [Marinimicrobium alkaliphilum]|uniref:hypothetical protein n=1 Tax=Marinimicrobium alkaliphilum TaxID=2202654 RepID=UPI000DBA2EE1|nr:hypothetical protein [Marinimicrobium alkaliphilum]
MKHNGNRVALALAALAVVPGLSAQEVAQSTELEQLRERVIELEAQTDDMLQAAVAGSERVADQAVAAHEPDVRIGGALRYNFIHRDFVNASESKYGESGFDVFRLNVDGEVDGIIISAEYRFYSYMHTLKHGWLGYEFEDGSLVQFGVNQVPFGLLPYAAHNAWFGVPYYLGFADDYDMGIKYQREDGPWSLHLAFYKNEELNDPGNLNRYSFDPAVVPDDDQYNEQVNQFNARVAYNFGRGSGCETELGGSAQVAQLYNSATDRSGDHWAAAAHVDTRCGRWSFQLQGLTYDYTPRNPEGVSEDTITLGAFAGAYAIDSQADVIVANVAYNFDSPWERIDQITCYNDYSHMTKSTEGALDSRINTTGCAIGSGAIFTYVDHIYANNMAYFGNGSLAGGGEDRWHSRLNVNIGFYW